MPDLGSIQGNLRTNRAIEAVGELSKQNEIAELSAEQATSKESFANQCEEMTNPFAAKYAQRRKTIKNRAAIKEINKMGKEGDPLAAIKNIQDKAGKFQQKNPELKSAVLIILRDSIKPDATKDEILEQVRKFYPDVFLADEALDFLLETTDGELAKQVALAKKDLNDVFSREIIAGRNISTQAREAAEKGLGTPTNMRDIYRDVTGNPRDATTLFQEFSNKYAYKEMKAVIDFMLHSLGADMKSKGPSIARGELHQLFSETRTLQAIIGVYRFFRSRMRLINSQFAMYDLEVPAEVNFENMTKEFMSLVADRYPTADKVMQRAVRLTIEDWIIAKIIAFSQFRDGVREVALNKIFRSLQHRDELYAAIIDALEQLEDQYEDEQEENEDEEVQQKTKNQNVNKISSKDTIEKKNI